MTQSQPQRIRCPVRLSTLFWVVPGGVEIRCKSCRGEFHVIRRETLEQAWRELEAQGQTVVEQGKA